MLKARKWSLMPCQYQQTINLNYTVTISEDVFYFQINLRGAAVDTIMVRISHKELSEIHYTSAFHLKAIHVFTFFIYEVTIYFVHSLTFSSAHLTSNMLLKPIVIFKCIKLSPTYRVVYALTINLLLMTFIASRNVPVFVHFLVSPGLYTRDIFISKTNPIWAT